MTLTQAQFLKTSSAHLFFEMAGQGFPLVFVHGLGIDRRCWEPQWAHFAARYQVIRYDVRGFGQSTYVGEPLPHAPDEDLQAILDSLNIEKAHLVGLSMGGNVVLGFAARHPQRVAKLIAVDADVQGFADYSEDFRQMFREVYQTGREKGPLKAKLAWAKNPLLQPVVVNAHTQSLETMLRDYSGIHLTDPRLLPAYQPPTCQLLSHIKAPTLVVTGEQDIEDFQQMADFLMENILSSQRVKIENAGHMPNLENPETFNQVLEEFLNT